MKNRLVGVVVTPEQSSCIEAHRGTEAISDYIRRLIVEDMKRAGKQFPQNLRPIGRPNKQEN